MEKLKITTLLWVIMAMNILFTTTLFGQGSEDPPTPPSFVIMDDNEGGNGDPVLLNDNGTINICYSILVANLESLQQAHPDSTYRLSPAFPAMGLSYTIGGNSGVVEFLDFQLVDTINGHPIFQSRVCIDLDFSTECNELPPPNPWLPASFDITGYFDVVQMNGGNALYPVAPYSAANSLFSCEVFDETCGYCEPRRCVLSKVITQISFEIDYTFNCPGSNGFGGGNGGKGDGGSSDRSAFGSSDFTNPSVSVFPTPSQQFVTLQYHAEEESAGKMQLFDATGKIVKELNITASKGLNVEQFDISILQNGLYYGHVHLNRQVKPFKIIKVE